MYAYLLLFLLRINRLLTKLMKTTDPNLREDLIMIKELNIKLATLDRQRPAIGSLQQCIATQTETQSIMVRVENQQGDTGYGESCHIEYADQDTIQSVYQFFEQHLHNIIHSIHDFNSLQQWIVEHEFQIDTNPVAWCAIELALLELFAKEQFMTVEALLGLHSKPGKIHYSAVIDYNEVDCFTQQIRHFVELGFSNFKLKLSGDLISDQTQLMILDQFVQTPKRVFLGTTNLWQNVREAADYITELKYPLFAIEEPLTSKDIIDHAELGKHLKIPIILDDACHCIQQMKSLNRHPAQRWILKLCISKTGGILRSLAMIQHARRLQIPIIIGTQNGDTNILTRATYLAATAAQDLLIAQEVAFGTTLLAEEINNPSDMFCQADWRETSDCQSDFGYGFGSNYVIH